MPIESTNQQPWNALMNSNENISFKESKHATRTWIQWWFLSTARFLWHRLWDLFSESAYVGSGLVLSSAAAWVRSGLLTLCTEHGHLLFPSMFGGYLSILTSLALGFNLHRLAHRRLPIVFIYSAVRYFWAFFPLSFTLISLSHCLFFFRRTESKCFPESAILSILILRGRL